MAGRAADAASGPETGTGEVAGAGLQAPTAKAARSAVVARFIVRRKVADKPLPGWGDGRNPNNDTTL